MDQLAHTDNPASLREELLRSFNEFELSFREKFPLIWLVTLIGPFAITIGLLVFFGLTIDWSYPQKLVSHAVLTGLVFGRFIILVGMESQSYDSYDITLQPSELFCLVTYLDFMTAIFVAFHMGFIFRLPYVGEKLAMLVWDGTQFLGTHPWVRRMAFIGLVLFVVFPTSTTGSIGGSIFGRLLGMGRLRTVLGVLIGSLAGNGIMWAFARQINKYFDPNNVWIKIVGVGILVALALFVEFRYQRTKKKYFPKNRKKPVSHQD